MQSIFCVLGLGLALAGAPRDEIAGVLDRWHQAAAVADEDRYFDFLLDDCVFLGTDATERWNKKQFREFAHPHFARGKAWSFKASARFITIGPDGKSAWFDEKLETANLGPCRGSGVLLLSQGRWKIVQYNLAIPVPNDVFPRVKSIIEEHLRKAAQ